MAKISILEEQPVSEVEQQWINEMTEKHGVDLLRCNVDELQMLRFCRAYVNEENPKQRSFDALEQYLEWYIDKDVDTIASTEYPEKTDLIKLWPQGFHGLSRDNHLVYIDQPGKISPSVLKEQFKIDDLLNWHIQTMEFMQDLKAALADATGHKFYKHVVVLDLDGFGLKNLSGDFREVLNTVMELDSSKYPETLSQMYIINPPFMFRALYAIASPFLDDTTKGRIHVLDSPKDLLQYIAPEQLPEAYGGKVKYTKEQPIFTVPFVTAEGGDNQYDDLFNNCLSRRRETIVKKHEQLKLQQAEKNDEEKMESVLDSTYGTTNDNNDEKTSENEKNVEAIEETPEQADETNTDNQQ